MLTDIDTRFPAKRLESVDVNMASEVRDIPRTLTDAEISIVSGGMMPLLLIGICVGAALLMSHD